MSVTIEQATKKFIEDFHHDKTQLLAMLREVQKLYRYIPEEALDTLAEELDLPRVHIEGAATFYHFFSSTHRGRYTVYMNTSVTSEMAGAADVMKAFEDQVGVSFGNTTSDQQIGLYTTSCVGMSDQEPAAIINDVVFPRLTPARVEELVAQMRANQPMIQEKISSTIHLKGPIFFSDYHPGEALKSAMEMGGLDVIEKVRKSGLRGRGGAGFSTGQKWATCRATQSDVRYVICNADEGEPGTFKDRVLLTENAQLIFEGMTIAGYAIESKQGIVYLRGEYLYLKDHLEQVLADMRSKHLLGRRILGSRFSFDIQIKVGAGAYICGEESALIESAEGKRGQPRNRPPFPVVSGYLYKPTIVNNVETFGSVAKIVRHGDDWHKSFGTQASAGVKLLSIAGDCARPGVYEIEWGKTVREVLNLCGAKDVLAVQVGGPSGNLISEKDFDRKLCYSDLSTGGAFTVFGRKRDLLSIIHNHMEFFTEETCGFCVPCRAGNTLLLRQLEKIMVGNGTIKDLAEIQHLGRVVKSASRCGLGQSSPNPLMTGLQNFSEYFNGKVRQDVDYLSQFNLKFAVADSARVANRKINLETDK